MLQYFDRMDLMYLERVIRFACDAHIGQKRKYTNEPYVIHPMSVCKLLRQHYPDATRAMVYAAILHDTVEDTHVTLGDIADEFGYDVMELVEWLTNISVKSDGNRAKRKAIDRQHINEAPFEAQLIKVADIMDNTKDIVDNDENFAKVYLNEVRQTLDIMRPDVKEQELWCLTSQQIDDGMRRLK